VVISYLCLSTYFLTYFLRVIHLLLNNNVQDLLLAQEEQQDVDLCKKNFLDRLGIWVAKSLFTPGSGTQSRRSKKEMWKAMNNWLLMEKGPSMKVFDTSKNSISAGKFSNSALLKTMVLWWTLMIIICIVILLPYLNDKNNPDVCDEGLMYVPLFVIGTVYGIICPFLLYLIRHVKDNFGIRREINITVVVGHFLIILYFFSISSMARSKKTKQSGFNQDND